MKKILLALVFLLLQTEKAQAYDLFTGMLTKEEDQVVMSRCNISNTKYVVTFKDEALKAQLPALDEKSVVSAYFLGDVKYVSEQYVLNVEKIQKINVGKSCKLSSLFG